MERKAREEEIKKMEGFGGADAMLLNEILHFDAETIRRR